MRLFKQIIRLLLVTIPVLFAVAITFTNDLSFLQQGTRAGHTNR